MRWYGRHVRADRRLYRDRSEYERASRKVNSAAKTMNMSGMVERRFADALDDYMVACTRALPQTPQDKAMRTLGLLVIEERSTVLVG